ncbi:MAG: hypothetical protein ABI600_12370 [Luteolibacter sp.]
MKFQQYSSPRRLCDITLGILAFAGMCGAGLAEKVVMRDASTHEQLSLQLHKIEQDDPMKKLPVSKLENPGKTPIKDLISQSDIISFMGIATLVPKRAILQIPKDFADRIKYVEGSQVVGWADFYAANRGWITTVEISRLQAEGNESLPPATNKQLSKSGNLVVAVYKCGPISLLPLKAPVVKQETITKL